MSSNQPPRPGGDRRAVHHWAPAGAKLSTTPQSVVVVGGGIAGLAAATALAERGVHVTLLEADDRLGGRVAAWPLDGGRTMSRGFHAFFRQYYNLRALLRRVDPELGHLTPVEDYPLQRPDGVRDSFAGLPTTPPWSVMEFVRRSPTFTAGGLARVNVPAALELLRVRFPQTYADYDGQSAQDFLDRLNFPAAARDLALEVFARSFFADPAEFGAGELVAMFHTYFMGSAEGLLFDVPTDDYDTVWWRPLGEHLSTLGATVVTNTTVTRLTIDEHQAIVHAGPQQWTADAVVLATDPRAARALVAALQGSESSDPADADAGSRWRDQVAATTNAPPFVVVRLWFDGQVNPDRPAFLGTSGYGRLDNVSVLERFETGAARWAEQHRGSVVELHAYACPPEVADDPAAAEDVVQGLVAELHRVFPETAGLAVRHCEVLVRDDCTLIGPDRWNQRPGVRTPSARLVLAGDWVRCDYPVALMERAATTGFLAANALLRQWGVAGHSLWTAPINGLLARRVRGGVALP